MFTRSEDRERVMPGWWRFWLHHLYGGPTHVTLMRWVNDGWLMVEATPCAIDWTWEAHDADLPTHLAMMGARVVRVSRQLPQRFAPRGLISCVSVVKMALGVRCWWVITPKQLLEWLLAEGHEEVVWNGGSTEAPRSYQGRSAREGRAQQPHSAESSRNGCRR